ncbi:MAG: molybdate ABC transporter substrate-binding protein [Desulfobulbus sp.]|nr:molybdate ABC transporter substrate-binding protein [Desulfobulbus sp.]
MKAMKVLWVTLVASLMLVVATVQAGEQIRLSVAASMTDVTKEIIAQYNAAGNKVSVVPNFGPSGGLAKQINQGAPADIYISANKKWMSFLRDEKKIDPSSETVLAQNTLVFVGTKNPAVTKMADILALKQIAIGSPKSVPAGEYAAQAMEKAGIYQQMQQGNKLAMAKDVRQALAYADRGETAGAFVYKTDALLATQAVILFEVPQDLYAPVTYPIALTIEGAANKAAKTFYDYLLGPEAAKLFVKYGFSAAQ